MKTIGIVYDVKKPAEPKPVEEKAAAQEVKKTAPKPKAKK